jgi:hypothetical protein
VPGLRIRGVIPHSSIHPHGAVLLCIETALVFPMFRLCRVVIVSESHALPVSACSVSAFSYTGQGSYFMFVISPKPVCYGHSLLGASFLTRGRVCPLSDTLDLDSVPYTDFFTVP